MDVVRQHYTIDLSSNNNFVTVPAMQGDGAEVRYAELELISYGQRYEFDPEDTVVTIMGTKADGTQVFNRCEITEEGYILVEITQQMSASVGKGNYQIALFSINRNTQIKSFPFFVLVTASSFDIDYLRSQDEYQELTNLETEYKRYAEEASRSAANAAISESNASVSESNARESENNAANSASNAILSETNASNSATLAESWAVGGTNSRTGEDTDNAKYYAEQAEAARDSINSGFIRFELRNGHLLWEPVTP